MRARKGMLKSIRVNGDDYSDIDLNGLAHDQKSCSHTNLWQFINTPIFEIAVYINCKTRVAD